jgi:2,3-bisphosphoglycerate-independent phosphoglycerate mutase
MKYAVIIIDGAAGWALPERGGKTSLEIAHTPNLDTLAQQGILGLARTVPKGMEPSSACACMSVLGYDPQVYYRGRSAIEAISMGVPIGENDVVFRCNLVAVRDGTMWSYSSGYISTEEARLLIKELNDKLGDSNIRFFPGTSYRHICRITGREETLHAVCTPPHDISGKPITEFLPRGRGSDLLRDMMARSEDVLREHPVTEQRKNRGETEATMIWLFWGSGKIPSMPPFKDVYGLDAAMTSGVDLLRGLATMMKMDILSICGVTDGQDNDYAAQAQGALEALKKHDLVVVHIEAPDEAAHDGSIEHKIRAIEQIDSEVINRFHHWQGETLRLLIMPDHPTPIEIRTHCDDPVPCLMWGPGFKPVGAKSFTETEAKKTRVFFENGYTVMGLFVQHV